MDHNAGRDRPPWVLVVIMLIAVAAQCARTLDELVDYTPARLPNGLVSPARQVDLFEDLLGR